MTTLALGKSLAQAATRDVTENPATLLLVASLAEKGNKKGIEDAMLTDIARDFRGEGGPVMFPRLRAAAREEIARAETQGTMGQTPALAFGMKTATETAKPASNIWDAIGSIGGALISVGGGLLANKQTLSVEKAKLKLTESLATKEAAALASQQEANLALERAKLAAVQQQAALQQAAIQAGIVPAGMAPAQAGVIAGIPTGILLPVGIGVAALAVLLVVLKKRR